MKIKIERMMTLMIMKPIYITKSLAGILRVKTKSPILRPVLRKKTKDGQEH